MTICISENENIKKVEIDVTELTSKVTTGKWKHLVTNIKITSNSKTTIVPSILLFFIEQ